MKRIVVISVIMALLTSVVLIGFISPNSESGLLTTLSDGNPDKEFVFKSGGTDNTSTYLELNKDATAISGSIAIQGGPEEDIYPTDVTVDIGNDGDTDWAFSGKGYGSLGRQTQFSDGQAYKNIMFKAAGYNKDNYLKLPKNATIESATMKFKGYFGGEIYVITVDYNGLVHYTLCHPDGSFGTPILIEDVSSSQGHAGSGIADFDNDGDLDFIVGLGSSGLSWKNVYYYEKLNVGPSFAPKRVVGQIYASSHPMDFAIADFNKDGKMDFFANGYAHQNSRVFLGDGNGRFTNYDFTWDIYYSYGKSQGDLDGDGDMDIVIGGKKISEPSNTVKWYQNDGDGTSYTAKDTGYSANYGIIAGDYNNDGNIDILEAESDAIWYFIQGDGNGNFNAPVTTGVDTGSSYAGFGDAFDFNFDTNLDIICLADYSSGYLACYLGNGDASFGSKISIGDVGSTVMGVAAPVINDLGDVSSPKLDIGDDGSYEWTHPGAFSTTEIENIIVPLSNILTNPPSTVTEFRDDYGNEFYKIPLNFSSQSAGYLGAEIDIEYSYKAKIHEKPDGDLASEINQYMTSVAPGISTYVNNITIPIGVTTTTAGRLKISEIDILFNLPPEFLKPIMTIKINEDAEIDNLKDLSIYFTDPDFPDDKLNYTIASNSESENLMVYTDYDKWLCVAPKNYHWYGRAEVVVRATDLYGAYEHSNEFIIKVEPVEDNPYSNPLRSIPDITIYEGGSDSSIDLDEINYFVDPEGDPLYYKVDVDPQNKYIGENISVHININNVIVIKGNGDWYGSNVSVWIYCDDDKDVKTLGDETYVHQEFLVNVLPVNDAPYWDEIPEINVDEDSNQSFFKNVLNLSEYASDIDNPLEDLNFSIQYNSNKDIEIVLNDNNSIDLNVDPNFYGTATVGVRVDDRELFTDTTFKMNINPVNDAPTIAIDSHNDNDVVSGMVTLTGTAFDLENTIQYVRIQIAQYGNWEYISGDLNNWKFYWDTSNITADEYDIQAQVYDGELFGSDLISLVVVSDKNKPPTVDIRAPNNGSEVKKYLVVNGSASDIDGNVELVELKVGADGTGTWEKCSGTDSWTFNVNTKDLKDGRYIIFVRAYDGSEYSELDSVVVNVKNDEESAIDPILNIMSEDEGAVAMLFFVLIIIVIIIIAIVITAVLRSSSRRAITAIEVVSNEKEEAQRVELEKSKEPAEDEPIDFVKYKFATPLVLPAFTAPDEKDPK